MNLTCSDNQQVVFTMEVCGMYKQDTTVENENFQRIEIPSNAVLSITGDPELPFIRKLIAIPECDSVNLTVNITGQIAFNNYYIYPAPDFIEIQDSTGGVHLQEVFSKNDTTYSQNCYLPGISAEIKSIGYLRDQKYAEVFFYPIQFNPTLSHIIVYTNFEISLDFINPSSMVNVNSGIFNNVATHAFINYESSGITATINDNVQGNGNVQWFTLTEPAQADNIVTDYLIICSEPFFEPSNPDSEVLRIANHRATYNGFDVVVLNASNIISDEVGFFFEGQNQVPPNYDNKEEQRIRTCIRRIYEGGNAQHTFDGKLGYVLLIGDTEKSNNIIMPTSYDQYPGASYLGDEYPSDYYYTCLSSENGVYDKVGDLYIGRFCGDNNLTDGLTELHNIIGKTIYFESEATFGGWRDETGVLIHEQFLNLNYMSLFFNFMDNLVPSYFTVEKIDASKPNTNQRIYNVINDGVILFEYFGHGYKNLWSVGGYSLVISDFENNLLNYNKSPVVHAISCQTGWFDDDVDCFAEALTTYSGTKGFTAYLGSGRTFVVNYASVIFDPPTYFQELLPFTIFEHLSHITGEYVLESKVLSLLPTDNFAFNLFGDPALNIMAQGFEVTHDVTLSEYTVITNEITVKNGARLTIPENGQLIFESEGQLYFDESATLEISDNATLTSLNSKPLTVDGIVIIGHNVTFTSPNSLWDVYVSNEILSTSIVNATFEKCSLHSNSSNLIISGSIFNECEYVFSHKGDVTVSDQSIFYKTSLSLENIEDNDKSVTITGCLFTTDDSRPAVDLLNYNSYNISDNLIEYYYDGIQLMQSGHGRVGRQIIQNNEIKNCINHGIVAYNSQGEIYKNHIMNNNIGIWLGNRSNFKLHGNSSATNQTLTQEIIDNSSIEVYASEYSFPYYFRYNVIIDEDNSGYYEDPLVYHSAGTSPLIKDVRYNCWGNNFDPVEDFYPSGFVWNPIWCPNDTRDSIPESAEEMYDTANNLFYQEDFAEAKNMYELLITQYPQTKFSSAAMKELFALEYFISGNYQPLKQYYANDIAIQSDTVLESLGNHLIAKCDIKLENWSDAINYYENKISNPTSFEDSVFAIIDLGYTYFVMENSGLKSTISGKMPEHKPISKDQFLKKRNYLLSLIPNDSNQKEGFNSQTKLGELLQNVPNPVKDYTEIRYFIEKESYIQVDVFNCTGQRIKSINEGIRPKGNHYFVLDASNLKLGIYLYALRLDGQITDSKKMTIIK